MHKSKVIVPTTTAVDTARRLAPPAATIAGLSIGQYLVRRLQDYGIAHVFGIPGDYVLGFYSLLEKSPIQVIGCTREDSAGFAADAYARMHGMGAVCVTYCVGGLSLCNSVAGMYAEKSPVVVITGAPGMSERVNNPLLHHKVKDFHTQFDVFEKLCIAGAELDDPWIAFHEIDRVLHAAASFKRPVYLEIPRDMVNVVPDAPHQFKDPQSASDPDVLGEAVAEATRWISSCERPVILGGVEVHRFALQGDLLALAEGSQIAITTTLLGKGIIPETHPLFVGLYEGAMGNEEVTRFVEESDCVIMVGTFMTDLNLGVYTANLQPGKCIYATSEQLRIRHHHFHGVLLADFLRELVASKPPAAPRARPKIKNLASEKYSLRAGEPIKISRLMARLNETVAADTVVIADIGDALFSTQDLVTRGHTEFISPAYYTSMGFSIPAALGASVARPDLRVIVVVGDGAFQMTGMELATIVRHGFAPIVIVLDNQGYGTERVLHPGDFNEIHPWAYHKLPAVLGGGTGYEVRTEGDFDAALNKAWADTSGPSILQVKIAHDDCSRALSRLAEKLSKRV